MGNANGREEGSDDHHLDGGGAPGRSNGDLAARGAHAYRSASEASTESMVNASPPASPRRSVSPILFSSQVPLAPLRRGDNRTREADDSPPEKGVPCMITWAYGGNSVVVEGSWDNWQSRKMQRSGKDFSILLVLPAGIYHYKLVVDGEWRYIPEQPFLIDETGRACNILNVNDYVPENLQSVAEFEAPSSPDSSYGNIFPVEEDFGKEPVPVPNHLHLSVLGVEHPSDAPSPSSATPSPCSKPQHVVLNHLFIDKGWPSQSVVAMGLTHRFESKYVTVVLYKPLKK